MAIRVAIDHTTRYAYDAPTTLGPHVVRLRPAPHTRTPVVSYSLVVEPANHFLNWQQDPFGNWLARLVFPEPTRELVVRVDLVADLEIVNPFDFFVEESAETFPFDYDALVRRELGPYLEVDVPGPLLSRWLDAHRPAADTPIIDALVQINQALESDIDYRVRMEPGVQPSETTLDIRSGSCRDSGWLLVEILRHYGLAARFVSGYLVQLTPDVKSLDGPSGTSVDFTDLHAWAEVYLPGAGWVGLDPTSGLFAGEGHIPLACTPQPSSAAPISGAAGRQATEFSFHNLVTRIDERPRVTLPYDEPTWQRVLALGNDVDARLDAAGLELTMGGEPTFVSADDHEAPEWNEAALGPQKLERGTALLHELGDAFAPQGISSFAQGKWYPGEPTPRWALIRHWRTDGLPIAARPETFVLPPPVSDDVPAADGAELATLARDVARSVREVLGVSDAGLRPLHEDPLHHLHLESLLPPSESLQELDLSNSRSRRALVQRLEADLSEPVGWLLPLEHDAGRWKSGAWPLRRSEVFLAPGDSPAGLRLPLDSLPADDESDAEARALQEDNFDPLSVPLPNPAAEGSDWRSKGDPAPSERLVRTSLVIERRSGTLYAFLPPVRSLDAWIELVAAVGIAAEAHGARIVLEGYEPPKDGRLQSFRLTPDPGVLEVNIHPSRTFDELVHRTETLYEAARRCRLAAEKFMVDGRHTGTGGGNHVTLGGATPATSPFLKRPELLSSLITYWQHHPALSYVFSGLFVGPTSQAPRADEARVETVYELEMALSRMPSGEEDRPWMVDRLLRNLLIDLTGNTHRAEICIDKLYSPTGSAGRLGIVELRAFEMPPHARMAVAQALLVRALVARFAAEPYRHPLVRWGTELHDRFMLPHYLEMDLEDVIADLNAHGMRYERGWLDAFLEFRFPVLGVRRIDEVEIELRAGIEPWHVLGEEATAGGMARYVDSSVERMQVRVTGLTPGRHVVTCNGRALPLRPTGTHGEAVVGVRYRAWQPPFALHPDLPVDVPLVFDLVDTWAGRSLGGCAYHVSDPGGRAYEDVPVNANVAEARRLARFDPDRHSVPEVTVMVPATGAVGASFTDVPASDTRPVYEQLRASAEYPLTADLRSVSRPDG